MSEITTLADALPKEIDRVREIIKEYEDPSLNGAGAIAVHFMKVTIAFAETAIMQGDVVSMLQCYNEIKGYEL